MATVAPREQRLLAIMQCRESLLCACALDEIVHHLWLAFFSGSVRMNELFAQVDRRMRPLQAAYSGGHSVDRI